MADRVRGVVKFFSPPGGYGFIVRDDSLRPDIFVHVRDLPPGVLALDVGQRLSCDVTLTPKGARAINVSLVVV